MPLECLSLWFDIPSTYKLHYSICAHSIENNQIYNGDDMLMTSVHRFNQHGTKIILLTKLTITDENDIFNSVQFNNLWFRIEIPTR